MGTLIEYLDKRDDNFDKITKLLNECGYSNIQISSILKENEPFKKWDIEIKCESIFKDGVDGKV